MGVLFRFINWIHYTYGEVFGDSWDGMTGHSTKDEAKDKKSYSIFEIVWHLYSFPFLIIFFLPLHWLSGKSMAKRSSKGN